MEHIFGSAPPTQEPPAEARGIRTSTRPGVPRSSFNGVHLASLVNLELNSWTVTVPLLGNTLPQNFPTLERLELSGLTMKGRSDESWMEGVQNLLLAQPSTFELKIVRPCHVLVVGLRGIRTKVIPSLQQQQIQENMENELLKLAREFRAGRIVDGA